MTENNNKIILLGFALYFIFMIGDIGTTYYALGSGAVEGNPFARFTMNEYSIMGAFILKAIQISILYLLINFIMKKRESVGIPLLYFVDGIIGCTVWNNIMVIFHYWM